MRHGKIIGSFLVFGCINSANALTSTEIKENVDLMVRLCIAGGRTTASGGGGSGEANLSLRSLDVTGNVKGEYKVNRSDVEGLVEGINSAMSQVAASEADKVRDCLQPVRERLIDILLPKINNAPQEKSDGSALVRYSFPINLIPSGDNWLALRSEPGGRLLVKMGPETLFNVFGQDGDWAHVRLRNGETGWVHKNYIGCCKLAPP